MRAGTIELRLPTLRTGSYFPSYMEPHQMTEQGMTAVIEEAHILGVSTCPVDDLVQALGGTAISQSRASR